MRADAELENDVIVVGAGPTGLTLAIQAALLGARVRIVERSPRSRVWAPALAVQPRTMEVLRGLGVADDLLDRGITEVGLQVHIGGTTVGGRLHDLLLPETEYPFILFVPQPVVETVLRRRLANVGVNVEWNTEFIGLEQDKNGVRCLVRTADEGESTITGRYLVGCDGRDSAVRDQLGIPFRGRRYRQTILVADVGRAGELPARTAHAFVARNGIVFLFPLPSGRWRVIAPHRDETEEPDLQALVEDHTEGRVRLGPIEWMKAITPHHRVAQCFGHGRVFLAGDSAHTHSPAGAQGMNTGIQDAVNLGWKLGLVASGAYRSLLDTYEAERRPVARIVVGLTGLAFALEVSDAPWLGVGRRLAARPVARLILSRPQLMSMVARVVSGLDLRYRSGARAGPDRCSLHARPGTRLRDTPLVGGPPERVHRLIDGSGFHLLLFEDGALGGVDESAARHPVVRTHHIDRSRLMNPGRGRRYPAFVLVRPDGHIAVSGELSVSERIEAYLGRWLGPETAAGASPGPPPIGIRTPASSPLPRGTSAR